jgi:putative two-component system response regulator
VKQVRVGLLRALSSLLALRDGDGGGHVARMRRYCRALAEQAAMMPGYSGRIDDELIELIVLAAPLHDVGNIGLPEHIVFKPGKLDGQERALMRAHTTLPGELLAEVSREFPALEGLLRMAGEIIRHHHERWDGVGYPDGLAGDAIPLAARIVTVADVYDALRSRRTYRPALAHSVAVRLMGESSGQFDPDLLQAFQKCAAEFERIFKELPS